MRLTPRTRLDPRPAQKGAAPIADEVARQVPQGTKVEVVTADRELRSHVAEPGATSLGPSWLLDQL